MLTHGVIIRVSQTSGTGNTSNTTQDTNISSVQDGGAHEDTGGVEDIQDSTNEITRHIPSTQVSIPQVIIPCPDNIYTGEILYERIGSNKWLTRFIVVQNVKVFLQYIETTYPSAITDEIIRFSFLDPVNGYIELDTISMEQVVCSGWSTEPHKEPLRLRKRDADLFGSDLPIPPSCLITVWAKLSCNPEERLRHPVILNGIDSDTRKIYISRFLETVETTNTTESTSHQTRHSQDSVTLHQTTTSTGNDLTHADPHQLVECIKRVFDQNYSSLGSLFEDSIDIIASEMLQAGLISRHVAKKPTFHLLINDFTSGMVFMRKADKIINHIIKFLRVLLEMQGPFVFAAEQLKEDIHDIVNSRLGIELNLNV